ncbi:MAG: hypothetical protein JHC95_04035 [Solirubrobacteraceae bacterium]|nr:hypothetical protein [Solirubrobacteraceae bacterium]
MTWLRGLFQDLVDKRLWPFALAFLVAIVAAPIVLARGGGADPATDSPVASAAAAKGLREAVVVTADPGDGPRRGSLRNPFFNPPEEKVAGQPGTTPDTSAAASKSPATDSGTSTGTGTGTGTGSDTGKDSGSSGSTDSDSKTSDKPAKKGSGENGYDVTLRFGPSDADPTAIKDIPRLTPLPSVSDPLFVYLGVLSNGRTAVFMVGTEIGAAVGDGTCRPTPANCETLELEEGETEFLDVTNAEGAVVQYQLDIVAVEKRGKGGATVSASDAKASASAAKAGRKAVRTARKDGAADTLDGYRFDDSKGVIRRLTTKQRKRLRARASAASVLRVHRTGRVVAGGLNAG